jgi:putative Ca2+/H+ antiporter (TMEM165/GDT1 family)
VAALPRGTPPVLDQEVVMGVIIALLVLWVVVVIIGFAVKSLLWLAIVGVVLFVVTGIVGAMRRRAVR